MMVPPTSSHGQRGADGLTTGESSSKRVGACAATCGGCPASRCKTRMALLSATNPQFLPIPAAFCLGRLRQILPFLAAHAVVERKELLIVVALLLVLPSHALVAVVAGLG